MLQVTCNGIRQKGRPPARALASCLQFWLDRFPKCVAAAQVTGVSRRCVQRSDYLVKGGMQIRGAMAKGGTNGVMGHKDLQFVSTKPQ